MIRKLKVFPSLNEESNSGWIWIPLIEGIKSRNYVVINKFSSKERINCYCRLIDNNFKKWYNKDGNRKKISEIDNSIIISEYYRDKLGVKKNNEYNFEIKKVRRYDIINIIRALIQHPDNAIKIATWLALCSILLSILGLILGFIGIIKTANDTIYNIY